MIGLVDLHDEHRRPFEHELIRHGLRWRDFPNEGFTWADLAAIIECAPPDGPLVSTIHPEASVRDDVALLRSIEHSARWLVWSKSQDAKYGRPPKPWRFAWETDEDDGFKATPMTPSEVNALLGWEDLVRVENERRAAAGQPLVPV